MNNRRDFIKKVSGASAGAIVIPGIINCGNKGKKAATTLASDDSTLLDVHIEWPEFLSRHDLIWNSMPTSWKDAAFLGNGRLALSVQQEPGRNAIRFAVDRTDVYDRRNDSWGWTAYSRPRYHVGDFLLA